METHDLAPRRTSARRVARVLNGDSPLLGKGNNAPPCGLPARDLDGHPRVFHGIVDMGAYQESVFSSGFDPAT